MAVLGQHPADVFQQIDGLDRQKNVERNQKAEQLRFDPGGRAQTGAERCRRLQRQRSVIDDSVGLGEIADERILVQRDQAGEDEDFFVSLFVLKISTISSSILSDETRPSTRQ